MPEYILIQSPQAHDFQVKVNAAIKSGLNLYGPPFAMSGLHTQVVGTDLHECTGGSGSPSPSSGALKIRHLTSPTYTIATADRDYMLVFDVSADVTITLPPIPGATDDSTFSVLAVNTLGRINLMSAPGETLVAYAPHAEQSATIGLTRGAVKWYATGTNIPVEEA